MHIWEIVKELKENEWADWHFRRHADTGKGFWTVNSDEIFQHTDEDGTTVECGFSVDDVTKDDWFFPESNVKT